MHPDKARSFIDENTIGAQGAGLCMLANPNIQLMRQYILCLLACWHMQTLVCMPAGFVCMFASTYNGQFEDVEATDKMISMPPWPLESSGLVVACHLNMSKALKFQILPHG